ncbi:MAG: efflux RND transporter periplasmic adaptor subunit [Pirellulales bacterium]|nr:efflux RND transporter periplasmic adaptor subunit [Pirellulales bacterium]
MRVIHRTRQFTVGAVALLVLGFATPAWSQPPGPVNVAVSQAVEQQVASGKSFVATVAPLRKSTVGSAVDGRVLDFMVNEGDRVAKNQPLCQVRTKTYEIQLQAAKATLAFRQQELAELKNGSRPEEVAQAKARMLGAESQVGYTRSRADRTKQLFDRHATSQEELDIATSAAIKAQQDFLEAQAAYEMAVTGPRPEEIAQAEAQVLVAEEETHRLEDILERHTIVAPFDGYIIKENTEVGQWLKSGDPVVDIVELDKVDVEALVLEDYIQQIQIGAPARVEIGAIPNETFTGEVAVIVAQADVRSRTFPVRVRLENRIVAGAPVLKSGMFARVTLPVGQPTVATLVPKDAVVLGGPQALVYVIDAAAGAKQGKVRTVPVEIGVASGGLIQVTGDVRPGQTVVVEGNERLRPQQEVAIVRTISAAELQKRITVSDESRVTDPRKVGGVIDQTQPLRSPNGGGASGR